MQQDAGNASNSAQAEELKMAFWSQCRQCHAAACTECEAHVNLGMPLGGRSTQSTLSTERQTTQWHKNHVANLVRMAKIYRDIYHTGLGEC